MDLRLHDPDLTAERLGRGDRLLGRGRYAAGRNGYSVRRKDFFRLIFVKIHRDPPNLLD
jgi:hypothetical protein